MSGCSMGDYSKGTAFIGLGAFRPTALTPFQFAAFVDPLGEMTLQQATVSTAVIGTGFVIAHYAGLFKDNVRVSPKSELPALAQVHNVTVADGQEVVGVHWMDFPAGYFPAKVAAHTDDGNACVLESPFDPGYSVAEKPPFKWLKYPAGYFPQNIPAYTDDGLVSELESAFQPEIVFCTPDEAPAPPKWFELYSEFVPSKMDPLVDDEVPFGYTADLVCPVNSEKVERAFDLIRNPPTPVQLTPSTVQSTLDTSTGFPQLLIIAIATMLCTAIGVVFSIIHARMVSDLGLGAEEDAENTVDVAPDSMEIPFHDPIEDQLEGHPVDEVHEDQAVEDRVGLEEVASEFDVEIPAGVVDLPSVDAEEVVLPGLDEVVRDFAEATRDQQSVHKDTDVQVAHQILEEHSVEEKADLLEEASGPDTENLADIVDPPRIEAAEVFIPSLEDVLKHIQAIEDRYWSGEFDEVPDAKVPEDEVSEFEVLEEEDLEEKVPEDISGGRRRRRRRKNTAADNQAADNIAEASVSVTVPVPIASTSTSLPEDNNEPPEVKKRRNRGSNRKRPARGGAASNRDV